MGREGDRTFLSHFSDCQRTAVSHAAGHWVCVLLCSTCAIVHERVAGSLVRPPQRLVARTTVNLAVHGVHLRM